MIHGMIFMTRALIIMINKHNDTQTQKIRQLLNTTAHSNIQSIIKNIFILQFVILFYNLCNFLLIYFFLLYVCMLHLQIL